MFKRKPIYIAGLIFFTLLLIADLVVFFLVPTGGGRGDMPNFGSGNFGDMGDFDGQMPDMGDFDFGNMPNMGGSGFGGQRPGVDFAANGSQNGSFLTTVRSAFWPILIIALLGDGICIFMLVRISRREQEQMETQEIGDDELRRRGRVNIALAAVAGILVLAVVLTSLPGGNTGATREAETAVQEAKAEYAELVNVFSGSGTLQPSDSVQAQIPAAVKILAFSVENGDAVAAGDEIAKVDKTSVLKAMYEVQELLSQLDGELAKVQGNTLADTVTAQAAGRVKAIYVAQGDSVSASMYQNGALLLISLGGSMTVEVESTASVTVGQSLTVTLSDGTSLEGKVQQAHSGKITVTTTDDGPVPGDTVTVTDEDGNALGTGILNVSSPLKVVTYSGTVSSIAVSLNQKVEMGDVLLTLENTQDTARYASLLDTRKSLTDLLQSLTQMYQEGIIQAGSSGIVSDLGEEADAVTTAAGSSMPSMGGNTQTPGFGQQEEQETAYAVQMSTLCAITPAERMTVDISVDELDILSLSMGQEAVITLDALPGQSFAGTVKKLGLTGTNEGGSTKYTVTMEVPRTEQMLPGMNASVLIEVSRLDSVLTIPAAAVQEDGNRTYVYTALDEKTERPTNPVDVTTGSSDGESIEILSGLSEGDAVYYSYADSIVYRFAS